MCPRDDPFRQVLGSGRGLTDPGLLGAELQETKDELAKAAAELQAAERREAELREDLARRTHALQRATTERNNALQLVNQANARETGLRVECQRTRYAVLRLGHRDPMPDWPSASTHQGIWTPGRPYLSHQHVWHPRTGDCYCADKGGAPVGEVPGTGRQWAACMHQEACPEPEPLPLDEMEHPCAGQAVRQTELWWDRNREVWRIKEIDDEYLANIMSFLREHARDMCVSEARWEVPFVPCSPNAYPSPAAWLADTPLMRALLRERRRRRDAARRHGPGQGVRS